MFGLTSRGKSGIANASGGSAGSPNSRTKKRGKWRAHRRHNKALLLSLSQTNPTGSKLLRRFHKAKHGGDSQHTALAAALADYAQRVEPTFRAGESWARIAESMPAREA